MGSGPLKNKGRFPLPRPTAKEEYRQIAETICAMNWTTAMVAGAAATRRISGDFGAAYISSMTQTNLIPRHGYGFDRQRLSTAPPKNTTLTGFCTQATRGKLRQGQPLARRP